MNSALHIQNLHAWYGESHVLHGVEINVRRGQVVALLGRNGSGRTTILRAILGLTGRREGSILVQGAETVKLPTYRIVHLGIGYCPEERGIFASLTCEENLMLPPTVASSAKGGMPLAKIYELFPNLAERKNSPGGKLSGGEQQMLAIARILRTGADMLLLDEISEGLAPVIVQALGRAIKILKSDGYTIVMVEQNFHFAMPLADYFYVMEQGKVMDEFSVDDLPEKRRHLDSMLSI